jgi:hypothetical protein
MLKSVFILILFFFLPLSGRGQEEVVKEPLSENGGRVIIKNSAGPNEAPAPQVAPPPDPAVIDPDNTGTAELEMERKKNMERALKNQQIAEAVAKPVLSPLEEIEKLGHKSLDIKALLDVKVIAIFQKSMREGLMSSMTQDQVKSMILDMTKDSNPFAHKIFVGFPRFLDFIADFLRDKEAFPSLLGILARKDDLKSYGYIWIAIFLLSLYIKTRIIKPKWHFLRRMYWSFCITLVMTTFSLFIFNSFFSEEIAPTISLITKHLIGSKT